RPERAGFEGNSYARFRCFLRRAATMAPLCSATASFTPGESGRTGGVQHDAGLSHIHRAGGRTHPRPPARPLLTGPGAVLPFAGMSILVVDDDQAVRDALRRALTMQGYSVELAADGREALEKLTRNGDAIDLAIVDILMPNVDGLELTRRLRGDGNRLPILMLTARDQVSDRVSGLEAGADDYLVKPFALEELVARVRALLRRLGADEAGTTLRFADIALDTGTREVRRGNRELQLTRTEFALLELFLRNPKQVLTRSVIFDRVWGYDFGYGSNSLDVYISYLRKKTEAGGEPRLIHTIRGVGYALREP